MYMIINGKGAHLVVVSMGAVVSVLFLTSHSKVCIFLFQAVLLFLTQLMYITEEW